MFQEGLQRDTDSLAVQFPEGRLELSSRSVLGGTGFSRGFTSTIKIAVVLPSGAIVSVSVSKVSRALTVGPSVLL